MDVMSAVFIALPIALLLAVAALIGFAWAVRSGQLDDLETPASRLLLDDDDAPPPRRTDNDQAASD
jgi:cbb3-type cytochrome oxidase maturation protein